VGGCANEYQMTLPKYSDDPVRPWRKKDNADLTPRVKQALRLYVTGVVKTQKEAAAISGIHQSTLSIAKHTPTGQRLYNRMDAGIEERALSLSAVIAKLSEKALDVMGDLIESGSTEEIRFQASKDILDRNPETSKKSQLQVESFSLGGKDAKLLAAALVEGRVVSEKFNEVTEGDFIRLEGIPSERNSAGPSSGSDRADLSASVESSGSVRQRSGSAVREAGPDSASSDHSGAVSTGPAPESSDRIHPSIDSGRLAIARDDSGSDRRDPVAHPTWPRPAGQGNEGADRQRERDARDIGGSGAAPEGVRIGNG
jgi:hypothetical protein